MAIYAYLIPKEDLNHNWQQVAGDNFNEPQMIDGNLIKFSDDVFGVIFLELYSLALFRRVTEIWWLLCIFLEKEQNINLHKTIALMRLVRLLRRSQPRTHKKSVSFVGNKFSNILWKVIIPLLKFTRKNQKVRCKHDTLSDMDVHCATHGFLIVFPDNSIWGSILSREAAVLQIRPI